jgi:hypothetical protein
MKPLLPKTAVDALPAACGWREVAAIFGIGRSRFYKLEAEGAFVQFELHPPIGPRRYSGELLQRYLRGEVVHLSAARAPHRRTA